MASRRAMKGEKPLVSCAARSERLRQWFRKTCEQIDQPTNQHNRKLQLIFPLAVRTYEE